MFHQSFLTMTYLFLVDHPYDVDHKLKQNVTRSEAIRVIAVDR